MTDSAPFALRPRSAILICILTWALCAALLIDALARAGAPGLRVLPFLVLAAVVVWALLWNPRVVLADDRVLVRNVLVSHTLPFAAIRRVRLGSMLRFDVAAVRGGERTITAWNAPGIGRDRLDLSRGSAQAMSAGSRGHGAPRPRLGPGERLARDQQRSGSAIVVRCWEQWCDARGTDGRPALSGRIPERPCDDAATVSTRPNTAVLGMLAVAIAAVVVRVLI